MQSRPAGFFVRSSWAVLIVLAATLALLPPQAHAARSGGKRNALFYYTHMQPSPYTQSAGDVLIGTEASVGVTDFLEVGTSLIRDFYQIFNAYAKVSILDHPEFAMALGLSFETYNLNSISDSNPDFRVTNWSPSVIGAYSLLPNVALFGTMKFNLKNNLPSGLAYQTSGFQRGAELGSDISWAYNPRDTSSPNALSAGVTYSFTSTTIGFGISHHWPGFHLGIHYYPNADVYRVHPIISGGMALDL